MKHRLPTTACEDELWAGGIGMIAGIDEAGRGALAGPVVAAAVVLAPGGVIEGVRDSKLVPETEREDLFEVVTSRALCYAVGVIENPEIDRINILQATFAAMRRAVESLHLRPDIALIDGRDAPDVGVPCRAIIGGDGTSLSIAAASIIAKVTRDRIMRAHQTAYPMYGFARHKGYATATHRAAILEHGPCSLHRLSFLGKLLQERLPL